MNGVDTLIGAMSNEDLANLKDKYSDNASVVLLIDGILETREREATQAKLKAKFVASITKLYAKLPHPDGVHNVYARWGEMEVESGEPEPVEVIVTPAEVNGDSKIIKPAVTTTEMRIPKVKAYQWVVEVNHAVKTVSGEPSAPKTSKRAITVKRIHDDRAPEFIGNFPSASKACEYLGLLIGQDSAMRVLTNRNPYLAQPYEGTDITS